MPQFRTPGITAVPCGKARYYSAPEDLTGLRSHSFPQMPAILQFFSGKYGFRDPKPAKIQEYTPPGKFTGPIAEKTCTIAGIQQTRRRIEGKPVLLQAFLFG
ncbi:hypothetical protein B9T62_33455 [Paenibacillus donghaensis]|uniref:Uncharacterized protein n=1 Tax=Paenibacillus donghaensis TaxID=414771 RepID=A0A2Z2KTL8_9BACL|nr:hypothetical protein B9T62_33455 [Paenibacillus donghaensis]